MANLSERKTQLRQELTDAILTAMREQGLDWVKTWLICPPQSMSTKKRYRGYNRVWLQYVAVSRGFEDPRWAAFGTIKSNRWHIPKGVSAAAHVEFWDDRVRKRDADGNIELDDNGKEIWVHSGNPYLKNIYPVWNLSQLEGVPVHEMDIELKGDYSNADKLIADYYSDDGPSYFEGLSVVEAGFSPGGDRVQMPSRKLFKTPESFISALAHETVHSTGVKKRLDRPFSLLFGSEKYAREELVAEFGAIFWCQDHGIEYDPESFQTENHAAYLQCWMEALKDKKDPDWLHDVITDACDAVDYIERRCGEDVRPEGLTG